MPYGLKTLSSGTLNYQLTDAGSWRVVGNASNNIITVLSGSGGGDILDGGAGNDRLTGSETNDVLIGGSGADVLDGGAGIDTVDYSGSNARITVMLPMSSSMSALGSGGHATGDTIRNVENLSGSNFNDTLGGGSGDNQLVGNLGADMISGGSGNDVLFGDRIPDLDGDYIADAFSQPMVNGQPVGLAQMLANAAAAETAQDGADRLDGGFGNDVLVGGGGNDTLLGGFGNDLLIGGSGDDFLDAGDGDTSLNAAIRGNWLYGGAGNDTLRATFGNDLLSGGDGNDNLNSGYGDDRLFGDGGNDVLTAEAGNDELDGGSGDDLLDGGSGADVMNGGDGDDTLRGGFGGLDSQSGLPTDGDIINGGDGVDTVDYSTALAPVGIDLGVGVFGDGSAAATGAAFGDQLIGIENAIGTGGNDIIIGSAANNRLTGGAGADILDGLGGIDTADYSGSSAAVTIVIDNSNPNGGTGSGGHAEGDRLFNIDRIVGSIYADTFTGDANANIFAGGGGADSINGGGGNDTADYSTSATAVSVNLGDGLAEAGGDAAGDILSSIERVVGSSFADTLIGDALTNYLAGGAGADTLNGAGGFDFADYTESSAAVNVTLGNGLPEVGGDAQGDILSFIEGVLGSAFDDSLTGDAGSNQLEGRGGADTLSGGLGNDALLGGDGNDVLSGGAGADNLQGGAGVDTADYRASAGGIVVWLHSTGQTTGQNASATVSDAAGDLIAGIENVLGSNFSDLLVGGAANNFLVSGQGNDELRGGTGSDVLYSNGAGTKNLYGDLLHPSFPSDGGAPGADTFLLGAGTSVIWDRQTGEDVYVNGGGLVGFTTLNTASGVVYAGVLSAGASSPYTGYVVLGPSSGPNAMTQTQLNLAMTELSQNVFQLNTFVG